MEKNYNDIFGPLTINTGVFFGPAISKKEELKKGDIVTLRNGDRLIYIPDDSEYSNDFIDIGECNNFLCSLSDLKDDLTYDGEDRDSDIVKVEKTVRTEIVYERKD